MKILTRLKNKTLGDVINKIEYMASFPRIRPLKTLYINLRCLPISQAIKFPIVIRGKFSIRCLGKIRIESDKINKGMIKFGYFNNKSFRPTRIINQGTIIFRGYCTIWEGVLLELGPHSVLDMGNETLLGENVNIMIRKGCKIGDYSRVTFDSQIMDSDFHYMLNIVNNEIQDCTRPIIIGKYNWVGNRTTIKKGTITPDFATIAAPNTLLSKDYRGGGVNYPILGGCPAKVIGSGKRRIYNYEWENILYHHFEKESEPFIYDDNGINPFTIPK